MIQKLTSCSEGAVTALVAIFGFFLLPNTPLTTPWLNQEERELAHARMERDRVGDSTEPVSSMEGLRQACRYVVFLNKVYVRQALTLYVYLTGIRERGCSA